MTLSLFSWRNKLYRKLDEMFLNRALEVLYNDTKLVYYYYRIELKIGLEKWP